jgi:hypothetical protein
MLSGRTSARLILALVSGVLALALVVPASAQTQSLNPGVFDPGTSPYGASYGEWSARWWQWVASVPSPTNPILDDTGANCGVSQSGPVWYLAGNFGGRTTRSCTVPSNKALLYPVLNSLCWRPSDFKTEQEGRACAAGFLTSATKLRSEVDDVPLQSLSSYRTQSPLFRFTVPRDNVFGLTPPLTRDGISDGFWIMLAPLSPGQHRVHFHGELSDFQFVVDVTYRLTVQ